MHTVVETPDFIRDAKAAGLGESERVAIVEAVSEHPCLDEEMPGTGGARKLRFAAKGKGKSGGVRVITFYSGTDVPVLLLNVFAKGQKSDLSQAERNELKHVLSAVVEAYRSRKKEK